MNLPRTEIFEGRVSHSTGIQSEWFVLQLNFACERAVNKKKACDEWNERWK